MIINCSRGLVHYAIPGSKKSQSFDARDFLRSVVKEKFKYKRGWSGRFQKITLEAPGELKTKKAQFIEPEAAEKLIQKFHRQAEEICEERGRAEEFNQLTGSFKPTGYRKNEAEFKNIWGQVPILPPDQTNLLALNAAIEAARAGDIYHFFAAMS